MSLVKENREEKKNEEIVGNAPTPLEEKKKT